jgi:hypothetical protein
LLVALGGLSLEFVLLRRYYRAEGLIGRR